MSCIVTTTETKAVPFFALARPRSHRQRKPSIESINEEAHAHIRECLEPLAVQLLCIHPEHWRKPCIVDPNQCEQFRWIPHSSEKFSAWKSKSLQQHHARHLHHHSTHFDNMDLLGNSSIRWREAKTRRLPLGLQDSKSHQTKRKHKHMYTQVDE